MSYARKTGYSGGGDLTRGARVFELKKGDGSFMHGSSYVVDDNGETNVDMDVREGCSPTHAIFILVLAF